MNLTFLKSAHQLVIMDLINQGVSKAFIIRAMGTKQFEEQVIAYYWLFEEQFGGIHHE